MSELLEEYDNSTPKKRPKRKPYLIKDFLLYIGLGIVVILLGIYIGDVLFGKRSFEVFYNLQQEKVFLENDIQKLKAKNAELQKQYFERRVLDPDLNK